MAELDTASDSLVKELQYERQPRGSTWSPIVSIVVTNRDGAEHITRLLDGLQHRTTYKNIELIVVDNGSTDASKSIAHTWPGDLQMIENATNQSFSHANNQGIARANGELVLLLNNDVDPINNDWLGHMVDAIEAGATAVGALLVYPRRKPRGTPPSHPDLTLQHLGMGFARARNAVRGFNIGMGQDPLSVHDLAPRSTAGVTAACLLARREDLVAIGGFDECYFYGSEDWDLSLRLGTRGPIVVEPKAALFHHEYGTQDRFEDDEKRINRETNRNLFFEVWGPTMLRRLLLEHLGAVENLFGGDEQPSVRFIVDGSVSPQGKDTIQALHEQATAAHWDSAVVSGKLDRSVDLLVTASKNVPRNELDRALLTLALPTMRFASWSTSEVLDGVDVLLATSSLNRASIDTVFTPGLTASLTGDSTAAFSELVDRSIEAAKTPKVGITTCAPDAEKAQFWGDTHFARSLGRGFAELGMRYRELIEPEWMSTSAGSCDAIVHLRGVHPRSPWPGQQNALWFISHPDRMVDGECDGFDIVASASPSHARDLSIRLGREVLFLPQATDPNVFQIGPHFEDLAADVLYVGNSRWPHRTAPRWMHRAGIDFHLYGKNWETFPEIAHRRAEFLSQ